MTPLLLALVSMPSAEALTSRQSGPWIEAGAGFAAGDAPFAPGIGWGLGAGWWSGRYDDAFAIGRYWSAGVLLRQDWVDGALRTAPLVEVRRGNDLLALGWQVSLGGGPLVVSADDAPLGGDTVVGATGRAGASLTWRRTASLALQLRVEGGADVVDGRVGAVAAALVGGRFARPVKKRAP